MGTSTVTSDELAILVSRVGLVENSDAGRATFKAALTANAKQARANLFKKVAASRAAAAPTQVPTTRPITAAEAQAGRTGQPTGHPYTVPRSMAASTVRSSASPTRATGTRIVECQD